MEGRMKRVVASVLVLLGWAVAARATDYQSSFGFTLSIPDDWLVLTKQAIKENAAFTDARNAKVGKIDLERLKDLRAKVESGSIEMFFDRTTSDVTFADNINVMVRRGQIPDAPDKVQQVCDAYPARLAKYAGRNLAVVRCETRGLGAIETMYVEFEGVVAGTVTMQYQIPRPNNELLLVTATCKQASLEKIRSEFEAMVRSIRLI
jgi:hypothetical protein